MLFPQSNRTTPLSASASIDEIFEDTKTHLDECLWLDFALFDAELDLEVTLSRAMVKLAPETPSFNPIIVFGNYLFDRFAWSPVLSLS
jgi:hypothetical protein